VRKNKIPSEGRKGLSAIVGWPAGFCHPVIQSDSTLYWEGICPEITAELRDKYSGLLLLS
jgi:hypothetical protein